jgi:hypothetical protein
MPQFHFGSGVVFATPTTGDIGANPTPLQLGTLQEIGIDIGFDLKQLWGRYQFPDDVAKAKGKISWKAKFARFNGKLVNDLLFGQTLATGQSKVSLDQASTIPATPYTLLVGPVDATHYPVPAGGTWAEDLGVRYAATGEPFTKVAAGPTVGQYTCSNIGTLVFAAADTLAAVLISYRYTVASGNQVTVANQLMGFGPRFSVVLMQQYGGQQDNLKLFACVASKLNRPTKTEDYTVMEFDGESFADASGNVLAFYDSF